MHVVRFVDGDGVTRVGVRRPDGVRTLRAATVAELLAGDLDRFRRLVEDDAPEPTAVTRLLPPVDGRTEVWAAGVTYLRSRDARLEESGRADVYDRVYGADRPELFVKAPAWRVVADGQPLRIRPDSANTVPEPELAAVVTASGEIAGWTVCDDLTSRSIEGENPLYLPQAKIWDGSCALAAGIRPSWEVEVSDVTIALTVERGGADAYRGTITTGALHRTAPDLVCWLRRELSFPDGVVLSTGTGIVPPLDFTLRVGDVAAIDVEGVGSLRNPII